MITVVWSSTHLHWFFQVISRVVLIQRRHLLGMAKCNYGTQGSTITALGIQFYWETVGWFCNVWLCFYLPIFDVWIPRKSIFGFIVTIFSLREKCHAFLLISRIVLNESNACQSRKKKVVSSVYTSTKL